MVAVRLAMVVSKSLSLRWNSSRSFFLFPYTSRYLALCRGMARHVASGHVTFFCHLMCSSKLELYHQLKHRRSARFLDYHLLYRWRRQPREQWKLTRARIYERDQGRCQSPASSPPKVSGLCVVEIALTACHIDHIRPLSSGGSNHASNLRTLCPICHALRLDDKHTSLRYSLIRKGLIPSNWQQFIWE